MIEDRIKVKINNIIYNRYDTEMSCTIYFSIYIGKCCLRDNDFIERKTKCKENDTFNLVLGKNLSRAYAELAIYKYIINIYTSVMVSTDIKIWYGRNQVKVLECMINTYKYYRNLIKKQHKYINSLLRK